MPSAPVINSLSLNSQASKSGPLGFWLLLLIMFFYSGIIDDKGKNPIGIPYIAELTIAVSLGAAVVMMFAQIISRKVVKLDFLIFALVTFFALVSSVFSLIKFNQPIIWGIIPGLPRYMGLQCLVNSLSRALARFLE